MFCRGKVDLPDLKASRPLLSTEDAAKAILLIALVLVVAKGFGSTPVFLLGVGTSIGAALTASTSRRDDTSTLGVVGLGCLAFLWWPVVHLYGFWLLLPHLALPRESRLPKGLSFAFAAMWACQLTALGSWIALPYYGSLTFLTCVAIGTYLTKRMGIIVVGCALLLSLAELTTVHTGTVEVVQPQNLNPAFTPGELLGRILDADVEPAATGHAERVVTAWNPNSAPPASAIVLLEHGQSVLGGTVGDLRQKEPWIDNQLFGDQYLLAAIAEDGKLASNLGGRLPRKGRLLLASNQHEGGDYFESLVIEEAGRTFVQDSDPFVDRLVPYQTSVVLELVRGNYIYRAANLGFVLVTLLLMLSFQTWRLVLALLLGLSMVAQLRATEGDVCFPGGLTGWPHEPSKAPGVLRSLVDSGHPSLAGDEACWLVVVAPGETAMIPAGTQVVTAGPGATIHHGKDTYEVGKTPLGNLEGIADARSVALDGQTSTQTVWQSGDLTVIGTSSPSKLDWNRWKP
jgi:hypothetical protein